MTWTCVTCGSEHTDDHAGCIAHLCCTCGLELDDDARAEVIERRARMQLILDICDGRAELPMPCIIDSEEYKVAALKAQRDRARAEVNALTVSIRCALCELGVPGPDYPAPVANAVAILQTGLAGGMVAPDLE